MKRRIKLLYAVISAVMIFSCCTKNNDESNDNSDIAAEENFSAVSIEFPSETDEITEYNKHIFDIDKFTASLSLPAGWRVAEEDSGEYPLFGTWSVRYFYSGDGKCAGAIGYNTVDELSEEEMKIPAAVYSQIALGNGYQFAVRERYDIVRSDDDFETALTDVYYSDNVNNGEGEKTNRGILLLDRQAGVYVAAEFESSELTDEQHRKIAESMNITQDKTYEALTE